MNKELSLKNLLIDLIPIICFLVIDFLFDIQKISSELSGNLLMAVFIAIVTIVPWQLGKMMAQYQLHYKNKAWINFLKYLTGAVMLSLLVYLFIMMLKVIDVDELDNVPSFFAMYGMFMIVLGPMLFFAGLADSRPEKIDNDVSVTVVMFIIMLSVMFLILMAGSVQQETWDEWYGFLLMMGIFIGACLAAILVVLPYIMISQNFKKRGWKQKAENFRSVAFPTIVIISLVIWSNIVYQYHQVKPDDNKQAFFALLLGGVIPYRILLTAVPPFSWISVIIGIGSLVVYHYWMV